MHALLTGLLLLATAEASGRQLLMIDSGAYCGIHERAAKNGGCKAVWLPLSHAQTAMEQPPPTPAQRAIGSPRQ